MCIKKKYLTLLGRDIPLRKKLKVIEWNLRQHDLWGPFPLYAQVEIDENCNLSCEMCNRTRFVQNKRMTMEEFEEVLNKMPTVAHIQPYGFGEALIHPKFVPMMELAKEKGMLYSLVTNGTLTHKHDIEKMLAVRPIQILFSVDHPDPDVYESIRPGAKFERVKQNFEDLVEARNELFGKAGRMGTYIGITTPLRMDTKDMLPELVKMAKEWGADRLRLKDINWFFDVGSSVKENSLALNMTTEEVDKMLMPFDGIDIYPSLIKPTKRECVWPKNQVYITVNGDLTICSCGYEYFPKIGNIFKVSDIKEIWNSLEYEKARQGTIDITEGYEFCRSCEGWAEDMSNV